ncbi:hypothetical protein UY3_09859 [Chelonia mydas]|uniref:Uncharacterized protein n=1 Tax=Chelonia mydas TaxID=8469 RepID=M7B4Y2_CHEMY|nr:hypothetical protein UY3_09859 [Chelonia mydas]
MRGHGPGLPKRSLVLLRNSCPPHHSARARRDTGFQRRPPRPHTASLGAYPHANAFGCGTVANLSTNLGTSDSFNFGASTDLNTDYGAGTDDPGADTSNGPATFVGAGRGFGTSSAVLDGADAATRVVATGVAMRRGTWIQVSGLPYEVQQTIQDLPFEGETLFSEKRQEAAQPERLTSHPQVLGSAHSRHAVETLQGATSSKIPSTEPTGRFLEEEQEWQEKTTPVFRPGLWATQTAVWPQNGLLKVQSRTPYQIRDWIYPPLPFPPDCPLSTVHGPISLQSSGCSSQ